MSCPVETLCHHFLNCVDCLHYIFCKVFMNCPVCNVSVHYAQTPPPAQHVNALLHNLHVQGGGGGRAWKLREMRTVWTPMSACTRRRRRTRRRRQTSSNDPSPDGVEGNIRSYHPLSASIMHRVQTHYQSQTDHEDCLRPPCRKWYRSTLILPSPSSARSLSFQLVSSLRLKLYIHELNGYIKLT